MSGNLKCLIGIIHPPKRTMTRSIRSSRNRRKRPGLLNKDEQLADQGEDSGDDNDMNEDDLSSVIFEAGCTEEVIVNNC